MVLKSTPEQARTRLLLTLWELSSLGGEIKKGDISKKVVRKGEKTGDYQGFLDELSAKGAIAFPARGKVTIASAQQIGELLKAGLSDASFEFKAQVGKNTANALLKLIREVGTAPAPATTSTAPAASEQTIDSYEAFKPVVLEVYDRLNRDYNFDDLVPIYRIRREIGDRVSRINFSNWLLKMQSNDILQLQGGSVEDSAPDKIEDSIKTEISGLRCYAKRLI